MKKTIFGVLIAFLVSILFVTPVKALEGYGKVTAYDVTEDIVTGNETSNTTVTFDEVNLRWAPAEPSIGRDRAGWWVGIKIEAPSTVLGTLENVKYEKADGTVVGWNEVSTSADEKSGHYVGLWIYLDEAKLDSKTEPYKVGGCTITWDETHTQTIDVIINPKKVVFNEPSGSGKDYVTVNIDGKEIFTLEKGQSLNNLTEYEKTLLAKLQEVETGYEFLGFFTEDGDQVLETESIEASCKLYTVFEKTEEQVKEDLELTEVMLDELKERIKLAKGEDSQIETMILQLKEALSILKADVDTLEQNKDYNNVEDETITDLNKRISAAKTKLSSLETSYKNLLTEGPKDDTPKTGTNDYVGLSIVLMAMSLAGIVILKKRFN